MATETRTCGLCRSYGPEDLTIAPQRKCLQGVSQKFGLPGVRPDFGCVLFEAKPVQRVVEIWPVFPNTDEAETASIKADPRGAVECPGTTHFFAKGRLVWLLKMSEEPSE